MRAAEDLRDGLREERLAYEFDFELFRMDIRENDLNYLRKWQEFLGSIEERMRSTQELWPVDERIRREVVAQSVKDLSEKLESYRRSLISEKPFQFNIRNVFALIGGIGAVLSLYYSLKQIFNDWGLALTMTFAITFLLGDYFLAIAEKDSFRNFSKLTQWINGLFEKQLARSELKRRLNKELSLNPKETSDELEYFDSHFRNYPGTWDYAVRWTFARAQSSETKRAGGRLAVNLPNQINPGELKPLDAKEKWILRPGHNTQLLVSLANPDLPEESGMTIQNISTNPNVSPGGFTAGAGTTVRIGRHEDSEMVVTDDPFVSRRQIEVLLKGGNFNVLNVGRNPVRYGPYESADQVSTEDQRSADQTRIREVVNELRSLCGIDRLNRYLLRARAQVNSGVEPHFAGEFPLEAADLYAQMRRRLEALQLWNLEGVQSLLNESGRRGGARLAVFSDRQEDLYKRIAASSAEAVASNSVVPPTDNPAWDISLNAGQKNVRGNLSDLPDASSSRLWALAQTLSEEYDLISPEDYHVTLFEVFHRDFSEFPEENNQIPQEIFSKLNEIVRIAIETGAFEIELKGLLMGKDGTIIAKGYVRSEKLRELRTRLSAVMPDEDWTEKVMCHVTVARPKQGSTMKAVRQAHELTLRHSEESFGAFKVERPCLVAIRNKFATRLHEPFQKQLAPFNQELSQGLAMGARLASDRGIEESDVFTSIWDAKQVLVPGQAVHIYRKDGSVVRNALFQGAGVFGGHEELIFADRDGDEGFLLDLLGEDEIDRIEVPREGSRLAVSAKTSIKLYEPPKFGAIHGLTIGRLPGESIVLTRHGREVNLTLLGMESKDGRRFARFSIDKTAGNVLFAKNLQSGRDTQSHLYIFEIWEGTAVMLGPKKDVLISWKKNEKNSQANVIVQAPRDGPNAVNIRRAEILPFEDQNRTEIPQQKTGARLAKTDGVWKALQFQIKRHRASLTPKEVLFLLKHQGFLSEKSAVKRLIRRELQKVQAARPGYVPGQAGVQIAKDFNAWVLKRYGLNLEEDFLRTEGFYAVRGAAPFQLTILGVPVASYEQAQTVFSEVSASQDTVDRLTDRFVDFMEEASVVDENLRALQSGFDLWLRDASAIMGAPRDSFRTKRILNVLTDGQGHIVKVGEASGESSVAVNVFERRNGAFRISPYYTYGRSVSWTHEKITGPAKRILTKTLQRFSEEVHRKTGETRTGARLAKKAQRTEEEVFEDKMAQDILDLVVELNSHDIKPQINGRELLSFGEPRELLDFIQRSCVLKDPASIRRILLWRLNVLPYSVESPESNVTKEGVPLSGIEANTAKLLFDALFNQDAYLREHTNGERLNIVLFRHAQRGSELTSLLKALPNVNLKIVVGGTDDGRSWHYGAREFKAPGVPSAGIALSNLAEDIRVKKFLERRFAGVGRSEDELAQDFRNFLSRLGNDTSTHVSDEASGIYQMGMRISTEKRLELVQYLNIFWKMLERHRAAHPDSRFTFRKVPLRSMVLMGAKIYFDEHPEPGMHSWQSAVNACAKIYGLKPGNEVIFPTERRFRQLAVREDGTVYFSEFSLTQYRTEAPVLGSWFVDENVDENFIQKIQERLRDELGIELSTAKINPALIREPELLEREPETIDEVTQSIRKVKKKDAVKVAQFLAREYDCVGPEAQSPEKLTADTLRVIKDADAILYPNENLDTNLPAVLMLGGVPEAIQANSKAVKINLDETSFLNRSSTSGHVLDHLGRVNRLMTRNPLYRGQKDDLRGSRHYFDYILEGVTEGGIYSGMSQVLDEVEAETNHEISAIGVDASTDAVYGKYAADVLKDAIISLTGIKSAGYRIVNGLITRDEFTRNGIDPERYEMGLFRRSPKVQSFISWLVRNKALILKDGAFIFDIDMTILPKGTRELTQYNELAYLFMRLLREGFNVAIISGSSKNEQMKKILGAIKKQMQGDERALKNLTFYVDGGATKVNIGENGEEIDDVEFNEKNKMILEPVLRDAITHVLKELASNKFVGEEHAAKFAQANASYFKEFNLTAPWLDNPDWEPEWLDREEVDRRQAAGEPIGGPWVEIRGHTPGTDRVASLAIRAMKTIKVKNNQGEVVEIDIRGEFQQKVREYISTHGGDPDKYSLRSGGSSTTDLTAATAGKVLAAKDYTKDKNQKHVIYSGDEFLERDDHRGHQIGNDEVLARDPELADMITLAFNAFDMVGADPKTLWMGRSPQALLETLERFLISSSEWRDPYVLGARLAEAPAGARMAKGLMKVLQTGDPWTSMKIPAAIRNRVIRRMETVPLSKTSTQADFDERDKLALFELFEYAVEHPEYFDDKRLPIFSEIRRCYLRDIDGHLRENGTGTDEAILKIKKELIPQMIRRSKRPAETKRRIVQLLLKQAELYFDEVDGFGSFEVTSEDDGSKIHDFEEHREDLYFETMQAIDALQVIGPLESEEFNELTRIAQRGLDAHRDTIHYQARLDDIEACQKNFVKAGLVEKELEAFCYDNAIRRWTSMEAMLMKAIANNGIASRQSGDGALFDRANAFLIKLLLDSKADGEGYYWVRMQAAFRLRSFDSLSTVEALEKFSDPQSEARKIPIDSVFVAANLDAANKNTLSLELAVGMSLIDIYRQRARTDIRNENKNFFGEHFEDRHFRVARLMGVLDCLVDPTIRAEARGALLLRIATIKNDDFALAANILLDPLEEMITKQAGDIFAGKENMLTDYIQDKARLAYLRIAASVLNELKKSENEQLISEFEENMKRCYTDPTAFPELFKKVHVVLGNLHKLTPPKTSAQAKPSGFAAVKESNEAESLTREHMGIRRKTIIQSGGGASVAMGGVMARTTTDPALDIISGTDDGGGTLLSRGFDAMRLHIPAAAGGDIERVDIEAAVMENVQGAYVLKNVLGIRDLTSDSFAKQLDDLHENAAKSAREEGSEARFESVFAKLKGYAAKVDEMGQPAQGNTVKGLIYDGIMAATRGHGDEFINPDGVYAALLEYRDLVGCKTFGALDTPFGNEMIIYARDGQEFIGQDYFSHTPKGIQGGRERAVSAMVDIDNYYKEVPYRSRVAGAIENADLVLSGLCSWGTSLGILFKNKRIVRAMMKNRRQNKGDSVLLADPVKDDETRGKSFMELLQFVETMASMPGQEVRLELLVNKILANNNANIDKKRTSPERPELGTQKDAFDGKFGGYAGANTPTEEDLAEIRSRGIEISADEEMVHVELTPKRTNPDEHNATITAIPELLAAGLWNLLSPEVKERLTPPLEFELIARHEEVEKLLRQKGLSWESLGMESSHELIFRPDLAKELSRWLKEGYVPAWAEKPDTSTWFSTTCSRAAMGLANLREEPFLDQPVSTDAQIEGKKVSLTFLSERETASRFVSSRIDVQEDSKKLEEEWSHRLGRIEENDDSVNIVLPSELLKAGLTQEERVRALRAALRFQLEKAQLLLKDPDRDENKAHAELLKRLNVSDSPSDKDLLGELGQLSIAVPLIRYYQTVLESKNEPLMATDMDSTVTAASTQKDAWMAYQGWMHLRRTPGRKEVVTGQDFKGPYRQMISPYYQTERRLRWAAIRTGISRPIENGFAEPQDDVFARLFIGAACGNAVYVYRYGEGFEKIYQNSMDYLTLELLQLVGFISMPEVPYPVQGPQMEKREPQILDARNHSEPSFAALAFFPSGRLDSRRDYDPQPKAAIRRKQAIQMSWLLKDPKSVMAQLKEYIEDGKKGPWVIRMTRPDGSETTLTVLDREKDDIRRHYERLSYHVADLRPIEISAQPGGKTTLDISPAPKADGLALGIEKIAEMSAVDPIRVAVAFVGDEMSRVQVEIAGEQPIVGEGNDFSVAKERNEKLKQVKLLVHTGPTGEGIEILPHTTVSYDARGVVPVRLNAVLSTILQSITRGVACRLIDKHATHIVSLLEKQNKTVRHFGALDIHDLNETQAREILSTVKLNLRPTRFDHESRLAVEGSAQKLGARLAKESATRLTRREMIGTALGFTAGVALARLTEHKPEKSAKTARSSSEQAVVDHFNEWIEDGRDGAFEPRKESFVMILEGSLGLTSIEKSPAFVSRPIHRRLLTALAQMQKFNKVYPNDPARNIVHNLARWREYFLADEIYENQILQKRIADDLNRCIAALEQNSVPDPKISSLFVVTRDSVSVTFPEQLAPEFYGAYASAWEAMDENLPSWMDPADQDNIRLMVLKAIRRRLIEQLYPARQKEKERPFDKDSRKDAPIDLTKGGRQWKSSEIAAALSFMPNQKGARLAGHDPIPYRLRESIPQVMRKCQWRRDARWEFEEYYEERPDYGGPAYVLEGTFKDDSRIQVRLFFTAEGHVRLVISPNRMLTPFFKQPNDFTVSYGAGQPKWFGLVKGPQIPETVNLVRDGSTIEQLHLVTGQSPRFSTRIDQALRALRQVDLLVGVDWPKASDELYRFLEERYPQKSGEEVPLSRAAALSTLLSYYRDLDQALMRNEDLDLDTYSARGIAPDIRDVLPELQKKVERVLKIDPILEATERRVEIRRVCPLFLNRLDHLREMISSVIITLRTTSRIMGFPKSSRSPQGGARLTESVFDLRANARVLEELTSQTLTSLNPDWKTSYEETRRNWIEWSDTDFFFWKDRRQDLPIFVRNSEGIFALLNHLYGQISDEEKMNDPAQVRRAIATANLIEWCLKEASDEKTEFLFGFDWNYPAAELMQKLYVIRSHLNMRINALAPQPVEWNDEPVVLSPGPELRRTYLALLSAREILYSFDPPVTFYHKQFFENLLNAFLGVRDNEMGGLPALIDYAQNIRVNHRRMPEYQARLDLAEKNIRHYLTGARLAGESIVPVPLSETFLLDRKHRVPENPDRFNPEIVKTLVQVGNENTLAFQAMISHADVTSMQPSDFGQREYLTTSPLNLMRQTDSGKLVFNKAYKPVLQWAAAQAIETRAGQRVVIATRAHEALKGWLSEHGARLAKTVLDHYGTWINLLSQYAPGDSSDHKIKLAALEHIRAAVTWDTQAKLPQMTNAVQAKLDAFLNAAWNPSEVRSAFVDSRKLTSGDREHLTGYIYGLIALLEQKLKPESSIPHQPDDNHVLTGHILTASKIVTTGQTEATDSIEDIWRNLEIEQDPIVIKWIRSREDLEAFMRSETFRSELRSYYHTVNLLEDGTVEIKIGRAEEPSSVTVGARLSVFRDSNPQALNKRIMGPAITDYFLSEIRPGQTIHIYTAPNYSFVNQPEVTGVQRSGDQVFFGTRYTVSPNSMLWIRPDGTLLFVPHWPVSPISLVNINQPHLETVRKINALPELSLVGARLASLNADDCRILTGYFKSAKNALNEYQALVEGEVEITVTSKGPVPIEWDVFNIVSFVEFALSALEKPETVNENLPFKSDFENVRRPLFAFRDAVKEGNEELSDEFKDAGKKALLGMALAKLEEACRAYKSGQEYLTRRLGARLANLHLEEDVDVLRQESPRFFPARVIEALRNSGIYQLKDFVGKRAADLRVPRIIGEDRVEQIRSYLYFKGILLEDEAFCVRRLYDAVIRSGLNPDDFSNEALLDGGNIAPNQIGSGTAPALAAGWLKSLTPSGTPFLQHRYVFTRLGKEKLALRAATDRPGDFGVTGQNGARLATIKDTSSQRTAAMRFDRLKYKAQQIQPFRTSLTERVRYPRSQSKRGARLSLLTESLTTREFRSPRPSMLRDRAAEERMATDEALSIAAESQHLLTVGSRVVVPLQGSPRIGAYPVSLIQLSRKDKGAVSFSIRAKRHLEDKGRLLEEGSWSRIELNRERSRLAEVVDRRIQTTIMTQALAPREASFSVHSRVAEVLGRAGNALRDWSVWRPEATNALNAWNVHFIDVKTIQSGTTYVVNVPLDTLFDVEHGYELTPDLDQAISLLAERLEFAGIKGRILFTLTHTDALSPAARQAVAARLIAIQKMEGRGLVRFGLVQVSESQKLLEGLREGLTKEDPKIRFAGFSIGFKFQDERSVEQVAADRAELEKANAHLFGIATPEQNSAFSSMGLVMVATSRIADYFSKIVASLNLEQKQGPFGMYYLIRPQLLTQKLASILLSKRSAEVSA